VAVDDGSWMLFKGGSVLSEFKKITKRISKEKKKLSRHGLKTSRTLEMLYNRRAALLKNAREGHAVSRKHMIKGLAAAKIIIQHNTLIHKVFNVE